MATTPPPNGENPIDANLPIADCPDMKIDLEDAGAFISVLDAKNSLTTYLQDPTSPPMGDKRHVYGHVFGLAQIKDLLTRIDKYNLKLGAGEEQIKAIRLYYGESVRTNTSFPLNPPDALYRDIIFMPVLANGTDVYPLTRLLDDPGMILSQSRPCPNQCSTFIEAL